MSLTALIAFYYVFMNNFDAKRFRWAMIGFISSSVLVSIWTALAIFDVEFMTSRLYMIPLSLTGTITGLKLFLGLSIPLFISVVFKVSECGCSKLAEKAVNMLMFIAIALNTLILSALYDKVLLWIILAGVGFLLMYTLSGVVKVKKNVVWVPVVSFILLIIVAMVGVNDLAKIDFPTKIAPNATLSWDIVKGSVRDNLFIGSGPATYGYDFSMYRPESFNVNSFYNFRFYQGTGLFFELIPTIGILGAVSCVILVLSFLSVSLYLVSVSKKEKSKVYSLGLISSMIILIPTVFLARIEGSILIISGLLASLTMAALFLEIGFGKDQFNLSLKTSPKYALALAFMFIVVSATVAVLFVSIGKTYLADVYAGKSVERQASSEESVKNIVKAYNLNRREGRYFLRASQEYLNLINIEIKSGREESSLSEIETYTNRSIELAKEGVRLMPNDVLAYSVLGQVYEVAGRYSGEAVAFAKEGYEKALELEPNNPLFLVKIGQARLSLVSSQESEEGKKALIEDAKKDFETAIQKKGDFALAYYNLSIANEALGDNDSAISATINAIKIDNSDINYLFNLARLYQIRGNDGDEKNAEQVYQYILSVNPDEINTNFSLAVLYEKVGDNENAIKYYEKVLSILAASNNEKLKSQVKDMVDNVRSGKGNLSGEGVVPDVTEEESVEIDESDMISPEQTQEIGIDEDTTGDSDEEAEVTGDDEVVDESGADEE
ncbi:tetratricopeptide repeat protein [Patescibacteria group bacterium]